MSGIKNFRHSYALLRAASHALIGEIATGMGMPTRGRTG